MPDAALSTGDIENDRRVTARILKDNL